jgi:secreted trypsin-like serine protease
MGFADTGATNLMWDNRFMNTFFPVTVKCKFLILSIGLFSVVGCKKGLFGTFAESSTCASKKVNNIASLRFAKSASPKMSQLVGGSTDFNPKDLRYRSTVGLLITEAGGTAESCSGGLVAEDLVVTAAHCLKGNNIKEVTVIFGKDFENASKTQASEWKQAPGYLSSREQRDDIAWVKLPSKSLPTGFKPAELLNRSVSEPLGKQVTLVGYGKSGTSDTNASAKRYAETFIDRIPDAGVYPNEVWLKPFSFTLVGSCSGDSGGAAFIEDGGSWNLFAVIMGRRFDTSEPQSCESGKSVVTLIAPYKKWIESSSGINFSGSKAGDESEVDQKFGTPEKFKGSECK